MQVRRGRRITFPGPLKQCPMMFAIYRNPAKINPFMTGSEYTSHVIGAGSGAVDR